MRCPSYNLSVSRLSLSSLHGRILRFGGFVLLASLLTVLSWLINNPNKHNFADYKTDADASLIKALYHGPFILYTTHPQPLMWPVALLVRLPALWVAKLGGWLPMGASWNQLWSRYEIGCFSVLFVVSLVILITCWGKRWSERLAAILFALVIVVNPLTQAALVYGHPEEILGTAFLFCGVISLFKGRWNWGAVLLALCFATKENFLLAFPTLLLFVPSARRWRFLISGFIVFIFATVPWMMLRGSEVFQATKGISIIDGAPSHYSSSVWSAFGLADKEWVLHFSHPLIAFCALALPMLFAWRRGWRLSAIQAAAILTLVMYLRSVLDILDIVYYMLPIIAGLLSLEWALWRAGRHPLKRLKVCIPIITYFYAWLSASALSGWLGRQLSLRFGETNGKYFLLVILVLCLPLTVLAIDKKLLIIRSRLVLYGGVVFTTFILIIALSLFGKPQKGELPDAPSGYRTINVENIDTTRYPVYWLGLKGIGNNGFLGASIAKTSKNLNLNPALILYGVSSSAENLAIFLRSPKVKETFSKMISNCRAGNCPSRGKWIRIPNGEAIVTTYPKSQWEAQVRIGEILLYLNSTLNNVRPMQVLNRLVPLNKTNAPQSQ